MKALHKIKILHFGFAHGCILSGQRCAVYLVKEWPKAFGRRWDLNEASQALHSDLMNASYVLSIQKVSANSGEITQSSEI